MTKIRSPKKSETIEVRVTYDDKLAFQQRCKEQGVVGSEVIRGAIRNFVQTGAIGPSYNDDGAMIMNRSKFFALSLGGGATSLAAIFAVFGLSAVPAAAESPAKAMMKMLDKNSDGRLSRSEFEYVEGEDKKPSKKCEAAIATLEASELDDGLEIGEFAGMDSNKDGYLSLGELEVDFKKMNVTMFNEVDSNGDGFVSHTEFLADMKEGEKDDARFKEVERHCEGFSIETEIAGVDQDDIEAGTPSELFDMLDRNKDGKLSLQEIG